MSLLGIILPLIVLGVLLWLVETYIPMAPPIPMLIRLVVVIVVVLWLLNVFGLMPYATNFQVPRVR